MNKEICKCYEVRKNRRYLSEFDKGFNFAKTNQILEYIDEEVPVCLGTRECDECSCEGDETKCTFYPQKAAKALEKRIEQHKDTIRAMLDRNCISSDYDNTSDEAQKWAGIIAKNLDVSPCITNKDIVKVVRCKDCKHYKSGYCYLNPNTYESDIIFARSFEDFCSRGESKAN